MPHYFDRLTIHLHNTAYTGTLTYKQIIQRINYLVQNVTQYYSLRDEEGIIIFFLLIFTVVGRY